MPDQVGIRLRLRPPQGAVAGLVHRPRLQQELARGTTRPVTLVSAGPGSGKTSTVADWAASRADGADPPVVAWLTVDGTDNDLPTFWAGVLTALTVSGALPPGSPLRDLAPAAGFGTAELRTIRVGLSALPVPVALVLDDFQQITGTAVLESCGHLLAQQPPPLRLVIATRADPPLGLHRLRVSGDLTEIGSRDLAFTEQEAAELFDRAGLHLSAPQLRVLLDRTQGWPAGLRLAAMSLQTGAIDAGIARFSGSEGSVAEYLIGEVTDRLAAADRDFLLKTSVAERLSGDLATELTGRTDGQLLLENLVAANAFVVGLAGHDDWFGYHPLFRELLAHRLALEQPDAVPDLHLRAARWFTAHGEPIEGIRHATRARNWDEVGRMLIAAAPLLLTAAGPAMAAALEPAAVRAIEHPGWSTTLLAAAVCHYQRRDYQSMGLDGSEAAEFLTGTPPELRAAAEVLIATVRVALARTTRAAVLVRASADLLALLDRAPRPSVPTARYYRVLGTNNLAAGPLWTGDLDDARMNLTAAGTQARELGLELAGPHAQAHLALLDVLHGRLRAGYRRATDARQALDRRGWASELQALPVYIALGLTHLARNQPDRAATQIDRGLAASAHGSEQACRLALGIAAIEVAAAAGATQALGAAVDRLGVEHARAADLPDLLARWCAVAQAQAHLAAAAPAAAIDCIDPTSDRDDGYAGARESIILATAHLALGQPQTTLTLLDPLLEKSTPYQGLAVEALILKAVATSRLHRSTAALEAITAAVDLAQPEGLTRPFVSAGTPVADLLIQHRHVLARHLDFTRDILTAITPQPAQKPAAPTDVEQLTDRELLVLRYLTTQLKAGDIGADLYLSINTVKSHLQSIYRKLGVTSRREAVDRGRALNLI